MARRKATRRRQLLVKTLVPAVIIVFVSTVFVIVFPHVQERPYVPGEAVEGITRDLERKVPEGFAPVAFRDVSREAGIDCRHFHGFRSTQLPEDMGSGVAWGDFDGDGDPDLYIVNEAGPLTARNAWDASPASNRLYRNEGDGTFKDVTDEAGLAVREIGMAAAWGDSDSDGDLDLIVTNFGSMMLFRNEGDGGFVEVTREAGIDRKGYWAGASWGDYDRDGALDLYVCGYVEYSGDAADRERSSSQYTRVIPASLNPSTYRPHANVLFRNAGDGTFSDATTEAGVRNLEGRSLGAAWCDFDADGWQDLYVANDISDNVLYRNRGDGTFEDVSHSAWVADYRGAMGLAIGDWDSDRDLDIFVSHWIAQENALYSNRLRDEGGKRAALGALHFMDEADVWGVGQVALDYIGWGTFFFDFDNDGHPDLFVANGSTFQTDDDERFLVPMKPLLFWNSGPGEGFFEVGRFCGEYFEKRWVARGAAPADYDGDGDLDIAVVHLGGRLALLRNESPGTSNWLGVRLRGRSNTFGVGARVTVFRGGGSQVAVVGSTPSYLSQPDLTLHFGLGADTEAGLEVVWPSGGVQKLTGVKGGRVVVIEEAP